MGRSGAFAFSAVFFVAGLHVTQPAFWQGIPRSLQVSDGPRADLRARQETTASRDWFDGAIV